AAEGNGKAYVLSVSELWRTNAYVENASGVMHATFSPDGKSFVTAGGNIVRVWDALTCHPITPSIHHAVWDSPGSGVAFSPDGQRLAIGTYNKIALILNATT